MAIRKTVRYNLTSVSNVVFKQNMEFEFNQTNERPNCFQIRNYSTQVLYVGFNSSLTTDNFEVKIEGGATRVITILDKQVTEIINSQYDFIKSKIIELDFTENKEDLKTNFMLKYLGKLYLDVEQTKGKINRYNERNSKRG
jgi:hypothetical protein